MESLLNRTSSGGPQHRFLNHDQSIHNKHIDHSRRLPPLATNHLDNRLLKLLNDDRHAPQQRNWPPRFSSGHADQRQLGSGWHGKGRRAREGLDVRKLKVGIGRKEAQKTQKMPQLVRKFCSSSRPIGIRTAK